MLVGNGFIFTKNFYNDNNNMKPVHRWMHQNRARQGFRMGKGRTEYIATYTNSKRVKEEDELGGREEDAHKEDIERERSFGTLRPIFSSQICEL